MQTKTTDISKDYNLWIKPSEELPEQGSKVEVITCENLRKDCIFNADDNWGIRGYPNDLYNNDIIKWRYLSNPK